MYTKFHGVFSIKPKLGFRIFCEKTRQHERSSALCSLNVNKVSRNFFWKKSVKLCLYLSFIAQNSFHFDEIFHRKFKIPILICVTLRRHLVAILGIFAVLKLIFPYRVNQFFENNNNYVRSNRARDIASVDRAVGCKAAPTSWMYQFLNRICEDCFQLYRNTDLYHMCRWVRVVKILPLYLEKWNFPITT